ncbi:LysR family transcriptional regulator, partial [Pseudomonas aeruginosa]
TWPGASPPSQPASASHPSPRQTGKGPGTGLAGKTAV